MRAKASSSSRASTPRMRHDMKDSSEYRIYIGCLDSQRRDELVSLDELIQTVESFFRRRHIDFSIYRARGGYIHGDGSFVTENTLCISMIDPCEPDVIKLTRGLSMFMNQEYSLVVRKAVKFDCY